MGNGPNVRSPTSRKPSLAVAVYVPSPLFTHVKNWLSGSCTDPRLAHVGGVAKGVIATSSQSVVTVNVAVSVTEPSSLVAASPKVKPSAGVIVTEYVLVPVARFTSPTV